MKDQQQKAFVSKLKDLLAQGKEQEVLRQFKRALQQQNDRERLNEVIILENNLAELQEQYRKGVIPPVDFQAQKNRINHQLISTMDVFQEGRSKRQSATPAVASRSRTPFIIGLLVICIAAFVFIPYINKKNKVAAQDPAPQDQPIQNIPQEQKTVVENKELPANAIKKAETGNKAELVDLTGRWRIQGQWGVVAEFKQQGDQLKMKLLNDNKVLYEGAGTIKNNAVLIKYELINGVGEYRLKVTEHGNMMKGVIKNELNNYQDESVTFRRTN